MSLANLQASTNIFVLKHGDLDFTTCSRGEFAYTLFRRSTEPNGSFHRTTLRYECLRMLSLQIHIVLEQSNRASSGRYFSQYFFRSWLKPSKPLMVLARSPTIRPTNPGPIKSVRAPVNISSWTSVVPPGVFVLDSKRKQCSPLNVPPSPLPPHRKHAGEFSYLVC